MTIFELGRLVVVGMGLALVVGFLIALAYVLLDEYRLARLRCECRSETEQRREVRARAFDRDTQPRRPVC